MRVYALADLNDAISPGLRRRMQGKSCFNFTTINEPLFADLAKLTAPCCGPEDEMGQGVQNGAVILSGGGGIEPPWSSRRRPNRSAPISMNLGGR